MSKEAEGELAGWLAGCSGGTHPELVIVTWRTLLDKGTVIRGDVAMVAVFLQHVDFRLDLLLFLLRHVHHLDGGQLARLHVTALVGAQGTESSREKQLLQTTCFLQLIIGKMKYATSINLPLSKAKRH